MKITKNNPSRLGIYVIFDAQGIVDRYITYFLEEFNKYVKDIVVVVNGALTSESRKKLEKITPVVLQRDNSGYDISAYKYGLNHIGFDKLKKYDEVIICNDTMFGPVYPFSELFDKMNALDVDFWGITKHSKFDNNLYNNKLGYIPDHIQSYFITFRQSLLSSPEFSSYWDNLPVITNRDSAIGVFETLFTKHFEDLGFKWSVYVDSKEFDEEDAINHSFLNSDIVVINDRCPVFKKKLFASDYELFCKSHVPSTVANLYDYLLNTGLYDVSMIWENVLRTCSQAHFQKAVQLDYSVSSKRRTAGNISSKKCAVWLKLIDVKKLKQSISCLLNFGNKFDIYVSCDCENDVTTISQQYGLNIKKIIPLDTSFASIFNEYLHNYDIVCNIDTTNIFNKAFYVLDVVAENVVGNDIQIDNILNLFDTDKSLGLLCYSDMDDILKQLKYYKKNFVKIQQECERLKLNVPVKRELAHMVPEKNCFWYRPAVFKKLEVFDDSVSSYYYSLIAQDAGYFSAYVRKIALNELQNIQQVHKLTKKVFKKSFFSKVFRLINLFFTTWKTQGLKKSINKTKGYIKRRVDRILKKGE